MLTRRSFVLRCGIPLAVALVGIAGCSGLQTAGSISETTNGAVAGVIVDEKGKPSERTRVLLLPAGYDPVKDSTVVATDTTDALGRYLFTRVARGAYAVFAVHVDNGTNAAIPGIAVGDVDDTVATDTLRTPGAVKVVLSADRSGENGYVYIPGTLIFRFIDAGSEVVILDSVPVGTTARLFYSTAAGAEATVIRYNVHITSRDTATVWNPTWQFSRTLTLNTSASGADVGGNVTDFPVLIRLNEENFDFGQSKSNGADIRFARSDTVFLPLEIERWDAVNRRAELWVKVDTVRGNNSTQSMVMYWGNPAAARESDGRAVFDTAAGFKGVWHLGEKEGPIQDVTINGYNGTKNGRQTQGSGAIGNAQLFSGKGDYTDMGDVCDPDKADVTVGIWLKRAKTGIRSTIISKSAGGNASSEYGWLIELDPDGAMIFFMATATGGWGDSGSFVLAADTWITDTVWHQVAVVIDRSGENLSRLYIDGTDVSILPSGGSMSAIGLVATDSPLRLGADANGGNPWYGLLDECAISFTARSEDWVRLSFMNQRMDDRLVSW